MKAPRSTFDQLEDGIRFAKRAAPAVALFNRAIAPRVSTEEVVLEPLTSWLAYQPLERGMRLRLDIQGDLARNDLRGRYDREYVVADVCEDKSRSPYNVCEGVKAVRLVPVSGRGAELHLFRGTDPASLSGIGADFDRRGIARRAFAVPDVARIRGWIDDATRRGRPITSTGHSLGGALAQRHHAEIASRQPRAFRTARLATFSAPGIDASTAGRFSHAAHNATHVVNGGDLVTRAGELRPGTTWRVDVPRVGFLDFARVHAHAALLEAELQHGRALDSGRVRRVAPLVGQPATSIERFRLGVGFTSMALSAARAGVVNTFGGARFFEGVSLASRAFGAGLGVFLARVWSGAR